MRVTYVGPHPEPGEAPVGGVEVVLSTLAAEVAACGAEVTVVVPGALRDLRVSEGGISFEFLRHGPGPGALRYWTWDAVRVARAVQRSKPDIIHVQGAAGSALFCIGAPMVLTVHGIAHRMPFLRPRRTLGRKIGAHVAAHVIKAAEAFARARVSYAVLISPYVLQEYPELRRKPHASIPNPVHRAFLETPLDEQRRTQFMVVGKVQPGKGVLEAIQGFAAADLPLEHKLIVAGPFDDATYAHECQKVANELCGSRVEFTGRISRRNLIAHLDRTIALLQLSQQETAPMAVAEALARGVPTIASSIPAHVNMVSGGTGVLVSSLEAKIVAKALEHTISNRVSHVGLRAIGAGTYSSAAVAAQSIESYRQILR